MLTPACFRSLKRHDAASRTDRFLQLTDEQWFLIEDLFSWEPPTRFGGRPKIPPRDCLEGILWVLRTGARWQDLPEPFPSYPTCWRRFHEWTESGVWDEAWTRLVELVDDLHGLDWQQLLADGTFARAKKGAKLSA